MKELVNIECKVPLDIFDRMPLEGRTEGMNIKFLQEMYDRYDEICNFLYEHQVAKNELLSWEHILYLFMIYVKKQLITKAISYTFENPKRNNIIENLMHVYTYDKFHEYIMGEPMIDAFIHAIRSISSEKLFNLESYDSNILLLRKHFLSK